MTLSANRLQGEVSIQLDRAYKLVFKSRFIAAAEQLFGVKLSRIPEFGVREVAAGLYAGMQGGGEKVTADRCYEMIDEFGLVSVAGPVIDGLIAAFGADREPKSNGAESPNPPAASGAGQ